MNITYKSLIKATVAISSLCFAAQAFAADAPGDEDGASNAGDIIVSARRMEERLQDVPISVAVLSQAQITKSNISGADDLSKLVPGLNVEQRYASETSAFSIRGFNQALRTTAAVGVYFGDVVAPRGGAGAFPGGDGAGPGSLFDLQNVQVLKGPQGTLFGRNTTGGAVLLVPKKPTDEFEGYVEGSAGNYGMYRLQGAINIPLASWAKLRVSADHMKRNGTQNNVSGIGPRRLNDIDYYAVRGSLVLDLSPELENYTIVSYSDSDHVGTQPQMYRANPFTTFGQPALGGAQVARLNAATDPWTVENNLANPRAVTKAFQVINTTTWKASDLITLKNIVSYATYKNGLNQSVFGTNFDGQPYVNNVVRPGLGRPPLSVVVSLPTTIDARVSTAQAFNGDGQFGNDQRAFTEELQLQGRSGDGKLNYTVGLYYEHSTPGSPTNNMSISTGALCLNQLYTGLSSMRCLANFGSSVNVAIYTIEYINMAAYTQATYAVSDQFKLTGGIRVTNDRTRATSQQFRANFVAANYLGTTPGAQISIPLSAFVAPTISAGAAGCQITHAAAPNCLIGSNRLRTDSTRPTWTLSAQYTPSPDLMLYATYSRGYRQGSAAPAAVGAKESFDPETVDSFELGVKTSWQGSVPGRFNATGFYSKLRDYQVLVRLNCTLLVCPAGGSATSVFNAARAHMYGIEFDASLKPADFLRFDFSGAWVKSRVDDFNADITPFLANFNNRLNTAAIGDPMPLTPEFSGNIAATFKFPIPESAGKLEFSALYRYSAAFSTNASDTNTTAAAAILAGCGTTCTANQTANANLIASTPVDRASAVSQLDLNLDWSDVGGQPIDLGFFVSNVTNQVTYTLTQSLFNSFGFDVRYLGQPRTFGARARLRF